MIFSAVKDSIGAFKVCMHVQYTHGTRIKRVLDAEHELRYMRDHG